MEETLKIPFLPLARTYKKVVGELGLWKSSESQGLYSVFSLLQFAIQGDWKVDESLHEFVEGGTLSILFEHYHQFHLEIVCAFKY